VFGKGILRCKCKIIIWKYVPMGFGTSYIYMADMVCFVRGYRDLNVEFVTGNM
jgi:hypothetical protein